MDKQFLEDCLGQGLSLKAIGELADKHPSTVSYWLKKYGLVSCGTKKYAQRGPLPVGRLRLLVENGATTAEMAAELDRSASTIRYWLSRHGICLKNRRGPRRRQGGGAKSAIFRCKRHGATEFVLEGRGHYRCKRCRSTAVSRRRRAVKRKLVDEAGGACILCGYDRWIGALQFHHLDPKTKAFQIGERGLTRSLARSRSEARKCVLLCANCHAEVEGGFATLPVSSRRLSR